MPAAWIGARKRGGAIRWEDESLLEFTNWSGGQPDGDITGEECVEFLPKGSDTHGCTGHAPGIWNDFVCSQNRVAVCEKAVSTCTCHYGSGNYCETRKSDLYIQGNCNDNELYFCPGAHGLPASSKGICPYKCMENEQQIGLDSCPMRNN